MPDVLISGPTWSNNILFMLSPGGAPPPPTPVAPIVLISQTVDTFVHAIVTGSAMSGILGGPWNVAGAYSFIAASVPYPEGFSVDGVTPGIASGSFNAVLASTTSSWAGACVMKFHNIRTGVGAMTSVGSGRGDGGFWIYNRLDSQADFQGGGATITTPGLPGDGQIAVIMFAMMPGAGYSRINKAALQVGGRPTSVTTLFPPAMGTTPNGANDAAMGVYYEWYAEAITGSWSPTIFDSIYNRVSSSLSGAIP